jgi:hypothetical protein
VDVVQWLGQVLPSAGGLMGWISPLLWIGWGLVMLLCWCARWPDTGCWAAWVRPQRCAARRPDAVGVQP